MQKTLRWEDAVVLCLIWHTLIPSAWAQRFACDRELIEQLQTIGTPKPADDNEVRSKLSTMLQRWIADLSVENESAEIADVVADDAILSYVPGGSSLSRRRVLSRLLKSYQVHTGVTIQLSETHLAQLWSSPETVVPEFVFPRTPNRAKYEKDIEALLAARTGSYETKVGTAAFFVGAIIWLAGNAGMLYWLVNAKLGADSGVICIDCNFFWWAICGWLGYRAGMRLFKEPIQYKNRARALITRLQQRDWQNWERTRDSASGMWVAGLKVFHGLIDRPLKAPEFWVGFETPEHLVDLFYMGASVIIRAWEKTTPDASSQAIVSLEVHRGLRP